MFCPCFSGLECNKRVEKNWKRSPLYYCLRKIGEDTAVETMKAGAHDYIMKGNLARLLPAIEREMKRQRVGRNAGTQKRNNSFS